MSVHAFGRAQARPTTSGTPVASVEAAPPARTDVAIRNGSQPGVLGVSVLLGAVIGVIIGAASAAIGVFVAVQPAVRAMEQAAKAAEKASLEMEVLATSANDELPQALRSMTTSAQEISNLTVDIQTITQTITNRFISKSRGGGGGKSSDREQQGQDVSTDAGNTISPRQEGGPGESPSVTELLPSPNSAEAISARQFALSRVGLSAERAEQIFDAVGEFAMDWSVLAGDRLLRYVRTRQSRESESEEDVGKAPGDEDVESVASVEEPIDAGVDANGDDQTLNSHSDRKFQRRSEDKMDFFQM